ncbi:hypothetical protein B0H16DRAFT_1493141 [Mycena metata]|uniref:Nitronate monooxygenase domain-containing protein n=1 Tax=Mycena metata TaxID=1033252 RepID=A0AAD7P1Y4_9AGAR|nr:hypothetical protein B0H16DRAFT_1493141 [Mycena metata]
MQWVGVPKLVAAVSNAGGLGTQCASINKEGAINTPRRQESSPHSLNPTQSALRNAIKETRTMTSKPFGVNITLLPSINPPDYAGYARAAVEEGVTIFETYFKSNGCIVIHKCTTIRHAKSAVKLGVDVLSIDGFECGLFIFQLLARAAKELKVPYLASGGIADARGFAAALALGAAGVNMGTYKPFPLSFSPYLLANASPIHQNIKEKIVASSEQDTVHIFRTLHNTARVFKNKVSMEVVAIERRGGAKFEDVRDLVSGQRGRMVYETGDADYGIWSAGISQGLITDIPTCEDLVRTLEKGVEDVISDLSGLVVKAKL